MYYKLIHIFFKDLVFYRVFTMPKTKITNIPRMQTLAYVPKYGFENLDHIWRQQKWNIMMKEKCSLSLWAVAEFPSVPDCHFKYDTKVILPDRHIILNFWRRKCFDNYCGPSLMVSMSCVVVIYHIIFMTRRVSFCYIWL